MLASHVLGIFSSFLLPLSWPLLTAMVLTAAVALGAGAVGFWLGRRAEAFCKLSLLSSLLAGRAGRRKSFRHGTRQGELREPRTRSDQS